MLREVNKKLIGLLIDKRQFATTHSWTSTVPSSPGELLISFHFLSIEHRRRKPLCCFCFISVSEIQQ